MMRAPRSLETLSSQTLPLLADIEREEERIPTNGIGLEGGAGCLERILLSIEWTSKLTIE